MKKLVMVMALCLGATLTYGQAKVELGLKGGLNFANLKGDTDGINYESRTGFHAGAYGLIKVANIGIQPEVIYSKQGTTITFDDVQGDLESDLVYLNFPIIAKFYLPLGLNLQAGPQFGMLLSAESDGDDIKEGYKSADLSAALGAGWDAPFGLRLTARYLIGLNDIDDSGDDFEQKNRMFQVSIGYALIKFGK